MRDGKLRTIPINSSLSHHLMAPLQVFNMMKLYVSQTEKKNRSFFYYSLVVNYTTGGSPLPHLNPTSHSLV